MSPTRRAFLGAAGAVAGLSRTRLHAQTGVARGEGQPLGIVIHSYGLRASASRARGDGARFDDPLAFLEHVHERGGAGIQVPLGLLDVASGRRLREKADAYAMYVEGSIRLPRDATDLARFTAEVGAATQAGVTLLRVALLTGRRYETFATLADFRRFADASYRSLTLAAPVAERHKVLLAIENHKDWRAGELVALLKRLGSEAVGVCLDTGNSIALLEDPMEVVATLAPLAFTSHLKDMGVEEYDRGFLLSEVPFGDGILDLPRIVAVLRKSRPGIRLNLEMITRDPLKVPCLGEPYWATFNDLPGRDLARTIALVRAHPPKRALPRVERLSRDEALAFEEENVRRCLDYAKQRL